MEKVTYTQRHEVKASTRTGARVRLLAMFVVGSLWMEAAVSQELALPELDCVIQPYEIAHVASPTEGVIKTLHAERNDLVSAGQVIVELEAEVEKASVALAHSKSEMTAEIELRQAALGFTERNGQRIASLYTQHAIPLHVKDEAATDTTKSRLQVRKALDALHLAQLELAKAQALLRRKTIRSPITGVVVERFKSVGDFADDQPIVKIAQLNPLTVEVIVPVEMFGTIVTGMVGDVVSEIPSIGPHTATVTMVDRVVDAASGTFDVRLELPNPNHEIPSGLKCFVTFFPAPKSVLVEDSPRLGEPWMANEDEPKAPATVSRESVATESVINFVAGESHSASSTCRSLGPINTYEQVESLEQALADDVTQITRREGTESVIHSYVVLAGALPGPSQTKELHQRLMSAGVDDAHLFREGGADGISLGVYPSRGRAEARRSRLAELGFTTQIKAQSTSRSHYWLNVHMSEDQASELTILRTAERIAPDSHFTLGLCSLAISQTD